VSTVRLTCVEVRFDRRVVVDCLELLLSPGQWTCIIGPNGAGKSSLLGAIAGTVASLGSITFDGVEAETLRPRARARTLALVPQKPVLPEGMTVHDYVLLGRNPFIAPFAVESAVDLNAVDAILRRLDLHLMAQRRLETLSGGETQRAVLARALTQEAPVLLLDEPTSALDLGHGVQVLELVDELRRERGLTVLSAMHDLSLAAQFADELVLLDHGQVVAAGSPTDVLTADVLSAVYGTTIEVVQTDHGPLVVPLRSHFRQRADSNPQADEGLGLAEGVALKEVGAQRQ
jgi:iron complex transport system ATP-binding protein